MDRVRHFRQCCIARGDPLQCVEDDKQHPNDGRREHDCFANDFRQLPDLMRCTPGTAETGKAKNHTEECRRYNRHLATNIIHRRTPS
jgi:hypothetical protein